jgi:hypothetical protein
MKVNVYQTDDTGIERKTDTMRRLDLIIEALAKGTEDEKAVEFRRAQSELTTTGRYWLTADILIMRAE